MERAKGFEPSTPTLARLCSTPELRPQYRSKDILLIMKKNSSFNFQLHKINNQVIKLTIANGSL